MLLFNSLHSDLCTDMLSIYALRHHVHPHCPRQFVCMVCLPRAMSGRIIYIPYAYTLKVLYVAPQFWWNNIFFHCMHVYGCLEMNNVNNIR